MARIGTENGSIPCSFPVFGRAHRSDMGPSKPRVAGSNPAGRAISIMQVIHYTWFTIIRSVNVYIYIDKRHSEHLGPDGTISTREVVNRPEGRHCGPIRKDVLPAEGLKAGRFQGARSDLVAGGQSGTEATPGSQGDLDRLFAVSWLLPQSLSSGVICMILKQISGSVRLDRRLVDRHTSGTAIELQP